jgi:histone acetyltransferase (RNA polymerase elongator complex component)
MLGRNHNLERYLKLKAARSRSGVISVTIFTSGELLGSDGNPIKYNENEKSEKDDTSENELIKRGGCPMNCHYCPFEKDENGVPTQPRSYLSTEPGNMRATQNKHHPIAQVYDRLRALDATGHINIFDKTDCSKIELII